MASHVDAEILEADRFDEWSSFVHSCPEASIYATPTYLDALCSATGGRYRILAVRRGDELVGGLPLYEERTRGGVSLAPRLLLYYVSPVLRRYETRYPSERTSRYLKVMGALAEHVEREAYDRTILKCTPDIRDVRAFKASGWRAFPSYTYVVPLQDDETMWRRIEQNQRRLVGRAEQAGVRFTVDDDFDAFHALHEQTMDRKDRATYLAPAQFERYFGALHDRGLVALHHARLPDGRAVATQMVLLGEHRTAQTVAAAADEAHLATGVNPFLRWHGFRALRDGGYEAVDLTDAALNPVTRFKSQLGGDLTLSLVVQRKLSLRWRTDAAATRARGRARGAAGRMVRALRRSS